MFLRRVLTPIYSIRFLILHIVYSNRIYKWNTIERRIRLLFIFLWFLKIIPIYTTCMSVFQLTLIQWFWLTECSGCECWPPWNRSLIWQHYRTSTTLSILSWRIPLSIRTIISTWTISIEINKIIFCRLVIEIQMPVNCFSGFRTGASNSIITSTWNKWGSTLLTSRCLIPLCVTFETSSPNILTNNLLSCTYIPKHRIYTSPTMTLALTSSVLGLKMRICNNTII